VGEQKRALVSHSRRCIRCVTGARQRKTDIATLPGLCTIWTKHSAAPSHTVSTTAVTAQDDVQFLHDREIAQMKATIAAMRDSLEEQRRLEAVHVQEAVQAQADEMRQMKDTVQALRDALEQAHRATDEAVQATTQRFAAELAQMREIAQAMRDKLDTERGELNQRVQAAVQRLEAENVQLRSTIQTMRDSMENPKQ